MAKPKQQLVDPFSSLNIDSHTTLADIKGRSHCPNCNASRKYFCYNCIVPMPEVAANLRTISLPIQVDIIKHPKEIDGKSTAVHAAIIAPGDVKLYTYPCIPHYEDKSKVLLVYPTKNAVTLKELMQTHSCMSSKPSVVTHSEHHRPSDVTPPQPKRTRLDAADESAGCKQTWERVVFIDSTWSQSNQIYRDDRLKDLQCIILNSRKTHFWRTQPDKPDTYLATIEAVYYFLLEYHRELLETTSTQYNGQYDNLLYFYSFMYRLVQQNTAEREEEERTAKERALIKDSGVVDGDNRKDVELKE